ncbi:MAG: hypothetical protein H0U27_02615 [Nitrosopumilus sp.]|nr:hypothetical protein [Nitrosopumilus sp.]
MNHWFKTLIKEHSNNHYKGNEDTYLVQILRRHLLRSIFHNNYFFLSPGDGHKQSCRSQEERDKIKENIKLQRNARKIERKARVAEETKEKEDLQAKEISENNNKFTEFITNLRNGSLNTQVQRSEIDPKDYKKRIRALQLQYKPSLYTQTQESQSAIEPSSLVPKKRGRKPKDNHEPPNLERVGRGTKRKRDVTDLDLTQEDNDQTQPEGTTNTVLQDLEEILDNMDPGNDFPSISDNMFEFDIN